MKSKKTTTTKKTTSTHTHLKAKLPLYDHHEKLVELLRILRRNKKK